MNLARAELWVNAEDTAVSVVAEEEKLRGGDSKSSSCLLLEFLRSAAAEEVAERVAQQASEKLAGVDSLKSAEVGVYRLLCEQVTV